MKKWTDEDISDALQDIFGEDSPVTPKKLAREFKENGLSREETKDILRFIGGSRKVPVITDMKWGIFKRKQFAKAMNDFQETAGGYFSLMSTLNVTGSEAALAHDILALDSVLYQTNEASHKYGTFLLLFLNGIFTISGGQFRIEDLEKESRRWKVDHLSGSDGYVTDAGVAAINKFLQTVPESIDLLKRARGNEEDIRTCCECYAIIMGNLLANDRLFDSFSQIHDVFADEYYKWIEYCIPLKLSKEGASYVKSIRNSLQIFRNRH